MSLKSSGGFVCQDASNGARLSLGHFIRNKVQLLGNPNSSSANRTKAVSEDDSQQQPKNEDKRGKQGGKVLNRIARTQLFRFSDHSRRPVGEVGFTSKREERKKKKGLKGIQQYLINLICCCFQIIRREYVCGETRSSGAVMTLVCRL